MPLYDTIIGSSAIESHTLSVVRTNGTYYTETNTHSALVPSSQKAGMLSGTSSFSWKSPQLDKSSFKAIKKSGLIKMTDYDVGRKDITDFIVNIPREVNTFIVRAAYTLNSTNTAFYNRNTHLYNLSAPYSIQGDLAYLRTHFSSIPYRTINDSVIADDDNLLEENISDVISDVVIALNSSYDPLTDLAELKETLGLLKEALAAAVNPLRTIRSAFSAAKSQKELGSLWMKYRYGIMPIIYSINDLLKTIRNNKAVYRTERATRNSSLSLTSSVGTGAQFYETLVSQTRVTGTGKLQTSSNEYLRLIDDLSINPFKTAWELIPFSFVVDWFVNVGDYIDALTSDLFNFYSQRNNCYAIKKTQVRNVYYRDYLDDRRTLSSGPWYVSPPNANVFERVTRTAGALRNADYLLRTEKTSSYSRRVFIPSNVDLKYDPFLNWKRFLDVYVLSLGNTRKNLRI